MNMLRRIVTTALEAYLVVRLLGPYQKQWCILWILARNVCRCKGSLKNTAIKGIISAFTMYRKYL